MNNTFYHQIFNPWKIDPRTANLTTPKFHLTSLHNWKIPKQKWDRDSGVSCSMGSGRWRVLCSPQVDIFGPAPEIHPFRQKLWELITSTRWLDWLIPTSYPEKIRPFLNLVHTRDFTQPDKTAVDELYDGTVKNVWFGTRASTQAELTERFYKLDSYKFKIPKFIIITPKEICDFHYTMMCDPKNGNPPVAELPDLIVVDETFGEDAIAYHPNWLLTIIKSCSYFDIPFYFEGWGEYICIAEFRDRDRWLSRPSFLIESGDRKIDRDGRELFTDAQFDSCSYPVAAMRRVIRGTMRPEIDGQTYRQMPDFCDPASQKSEMEAMMREFGEDVPGDPSPSPGQ
jgi:Protein of unknown function (DUF5131)